MYTLRIQNIIRLHHISTDHTDTTPLCLWSISIPIIILILIVNVEKNVVSVRVSRCSGVVEVRVTCCVEREEAGVVLTD